MESKESPINRLNFFGWGLLLVVVAGALIFIDQLFLFSFGNTSSHAYSCWTRDCSRTGFKAHPKYFFLLDPDRSEFLDDLSRTSEIEGHNDYKLNEGGFRIETPPTVIQGKTKVNIFGDSFTFGLFLREQEHIGSLLNAIPSKCLFRNYGVPAFDLRQMIQLSNDAELVAGSDIDVFLFISDDIPRIIRTFEVHHFGRAFDAYDLARELGIEPVFPLKIPHALVRNSFLFQKLNMIIKQRFWSVMDESQLLEKMIQLNQAGEKRKFYFHIPVPEDYARDASTGAWNLRLPTPSTISLGEQMLMEDGPFRELFFRGDGHPNPAGAKWIASQVMGKLRDICRPL